MGNVSRWFGAVSLAAALVLSGCGAATEKAPPPESGAESAETLTIAVAGMVTPKSALEYYLSLSEYIGQKVGRPVRLIHKSDYEEVSTLLGEERIDIAFVCSGPYVIGHDTFGLRLIAAPVVNGEPAYRAYIIVPRSSDATSLASLEGKRFAYADPDSNTGCMVPRFMLTDQGFDPERFFGETFFTYGHDNSIKAVATGQADGASVDSLIWDFDDATDPTNTSKTRIVETSEWFAIPPVVARAGLDDELFGQVQSALLAAHEDPEGKSLLDHMRIDRFVVIEDSAYDSIREMQDRIESAESD